jgi:hypothetical protein
MHVSAGGHGAIRPGCSDGRSTTAKTHAKNGERTKASRKTQQLSPPINRIRYEINSW